MIKKILCPTDFSGAAASGMEYASGLAQSLGANLTLVNIQKVSISEGVSLFSGGERESVREAKTSAELLESYCSDIKKTFGISCNHMIIPSLGSIEEAVVGEGQNYDLIILGTNGANELFNFYFGTHSYHVSKKVTTPVLIVPEGCSYKPFNEIVFASDYRKDEKLLLEQLNVFIHNFNSHVSVVHISDDDNELSREVFRSFKSLTEDQLNFDPKISFRRLVNKDIIGELEKVLDKSEADLIALSFQKHNLLYRMLHRNLIKEMTSFAAIPLLILHK